MTTPASVTGKANVWASLNAWFLANVVAAGPPSFAYYLDQALDPQVYPAVNVYEYKFFDPGDTAMGGVIFPANVGGPTQGSAQRMIVAIDIYTDGSQDTSALLHLRQLRDQFIYAMKNSGVANDDTNAVIVPPVIISDVNGTGNPTGIVCRFMTEQDNWAVENNFTPAPPEAQIFKYQILARVEWYEMR